MIWLSLLARFWWAPVITVLIATLWLQGAQVQKVRTQRDEWRAVAIQNEQNASAWEAAFRKSEKNRQEEQGASVVAINASEASCEARIEKARSSAVKIEGIVTRAPVCKPGEAVARDLVNPDDLRDAVSGLR